MGADNNPRQRSQLQDSYGSPLMQYHKGKPTDPQYYNKISVKSIKESVLRSKLYQEPEPVVPDTRFRMFKHRGEL